MFVVLIDLFSYLPWSTVGWSNTSCYFFFPCRFKSWKCWTILILSISLRWLMTQIQITSTWVFRNHILFPYRFNLSVLCAQSRDCDFVLNTYLLSRMDSFLIDWKCLFFSQFWNMWMENGCGKDPVLLVELVKILLESICGILYLGWCIFMLMYVLDSSISWILFC